MHEHFYICICVTYFVIEMKSLLLPVTTSYYILNLFIYKIINYELLACLLVLLLFLLYTCCSGTFYCLSVNIART